MEVYQPESPAARSYVPESPRKAKLDPNSFLGKLVNSIKTPLPPITPAPFKPVQNWRNYVASLRSHMKRDGWDKGEEYFTRCDAIIQKIVSDHEKWEAEHSPTPPRELKKGYNVPNDIERVIVKFDITKSGKVKVKTYAPLAEIHHKYYSKGVKPPTDVYIRALKDFGYPDEALEKVLIKAQNAPKMNAHIEEMIERVFGSTSNAKPSKPKRGTVTQELNKRLKNLGK